MRGKLFLVPLLLTLALLLSTAAAGAVPAAQVGPPDMVKVFVAFNQRPGPSEEALVRAAGGQISYTYHLVPAIAAWMPQAAVDALRRNPRVARVEPVIHVQTLDAELNNSWGVEKIGSGTVHEGGNRGAGVKVAVIDSGVDYTHTDLDGNFVALKGKDFVNTDDYPMDDNGHGTHVAGTIAAEDNGSGVVGVAPSATLYALKVLGSGGGGSYDDVIAALEWAADNGIQVTNNSYGSPGDPGTLVKAAFDNSAVLGVLHIAAAGNSGNQAGKGDNVGYPARYASVVAVAATSSSDSRASFSSTGPDLEVAAPGVSINSTKMGGGYTTMSGTSMASPHVAGLAALIVSGGTTDSGTVRSILQSTALDLGSTGRDTLYGWGRVDAAAAVGTIGDSPPSVSWVAPAGGATVGGSVALRINASDDKSGLTVQWKVGSGEWKSTTKGSNYYEASWDTTALADGSYTLTVQATDSANQTASGSISVTVYNGAVIGVGVTSINPNSVQAGSSVVVTISGSGFATGASVSFEKGNGPAPKASVIEVGAADTITATITAPGGGPLRPRTWDVRVSNLDGSSGVLAGGFTVTP